MKIELFKPLVNEDDIAAVAGVLRSGWLGLGPKTAEFEEAFAAYLTGPSPHSPLPGGEGPGERDAARPPAHTPVHVVATNSCTAALDMAVRLLGIGPGDEVIVPAMTFVSTAHAVAYSGATPVFCDVDPYTLHLDVEDVVRLISPRTKAIMAVHYGGRPICMDDLRSVAGSIPIIEDCAHAAGAEYMGQKAGTLGDMACFSFHAVKNLTCGDGGALVLRGPISVARARRLRWLGIDKDTWRRQGKDSTYSWDYSVEGIGLKCHMNDIQAALALSQLKRLDAGNARRREIAERYHARLPFFVIRPMRDDDLCRSSWHLYPIQVLRRDALRQWLMDAGIVTGVHYRPIHTHLCYAGGDMDRKPPSSADRSVSPELGRRRLPKVEEVFTRLLSLPMHLWMTDAEVDYICDTIQEFGEANA